MLNAILGLFAEKLVDRLVILVEKKLALQLEISRLSLEAAELQKEVEAASTDWERSAVLKKIANLHKFTLK